MSFTGKKAAAIKEAFIKAFNWMREKLMELAHSCQREHNELMLELMKEKDVASMSGRLLNRWGRVKKPQIMARIERLEQQAQITIPGLPPPPPPAWAMMPPPDLLTPLQGIITPSGSE